MVVEQSFDCQRKRNNLDEHRYSIQKAVVFSSGDPFEARRDGKVGEWFCQRGSTRISEVHPPPLLLPTPSPFVSCSISSLLTCDFHIVEAKPLHVTPSFMEGCSIGGRSWERENSWGIRGRGSHHVQRLTPHGFQGLSGYSPPDTHLF